MITLIHGDDVEKSREYLLSLVQPEKYTELRKVDGKNIDLTALATALDSVSMAGGYKVVVENLLSSSAKKPARVAAIINELSAVPKDIEVTLWEPKELTKVTISKLGPGVKTMLFKIPVLLFQFLDSIYPGNARGSLELYQKLRATEADELIFFLSSRRIRQLLILRSGAAIEGLAPWQASRLTSQARRFTIEKLSKMYRELLTVDYSIKSGRTPFSMFELLEQFLIAL